MARQLYGLSGKDRDNIIAGNRRANNNPLGKRGAKAERRVSTASAGDTYRGYCKVFQTGTNTVKIADGFSDDYSAETTAGRFQVNKFITNLPSEEFTITDTVLDSTVYAEFTIVGGSTPSGAEGVIKMDSGILLTYEPGKEKVLIARIRLTGDGAIDKISQVNMNARVFIIGGC